MNCRIVLNVSPEACRGLHIDNDKLVFSARFGGNPMQIFVTPAAILAIYAKENGRGMEFGPEYDEPSESNVTKNSVSNAPKRGKPKLRLVEQDKPEQA
jgi:stringent starvation protein B